MLKYEPLTRRLKQRGVRRVTLAVTEIDDLVDGLPRSAYQHVDAWWSNDRSRPQGRAWLDAGYAVKDVDLVGDVVTFGQL
jgi:hypothetical protein